MGTVYCYCVVLSRYMYILYVQLDHIKLKEGNNWPHTVQIVSVIFTDSISVGPWSGLHVSSTMSVTALYSNTPVPIS